MKVLGFTFKWPQKAPSPYPKPLHTFFSEGRCPDCGNGKFWFSQDGGHDTVANCTKCDAYFGIQDAPFEMIERIGQKISENNN
jgi:hypothetical protein